MSCGFLCFHLCGSGVPVTTTCHCCAVVFLQSRRMRRSLHTLRCVRPLRLMAQLSLPVCRRTAACSPQTDFPGVHTRPHPVSVIQGATAPDGAAVSACLPPHCGLFSADGLSGGTYTTTSRFSHPGERCTSHKTFCRRRQKLLRLPPDNCPVTW
ncbi:hypothetical protein EUOG_04990 [Escherichia coli O104:H4 str. 11-4632 C5]|nr:hypothetical protein EUOG_04990 [Escherichia coli O104:H4 str. 11-4632 C5]